MRLPRTVRTAAFRLALVFAALFAFGALMIVAFFNFTIADYALHGLRADVVDEVQLLQRSGAAGDAAGVARLVAERQRILGSQDFYYLVLDAHGARLAGDLPPSAARSGWFTARVPAPRQSREYEGETAEVMTYGQPMAGGGVLVVGRSTYDFHELRERMLTGSLGAAGVIALMSLGVAALVGGEFLHRVDEVSAAAVRIMGGRFDERLPTLGVGAEFERLGSSLNAMLDRMQGLMEGLRQVSSDIAHDLRTPLTRLRRRLEDALAAERDEAGRRAIAATLEQVDEILATFNALLRIAQVEGGSGWEALGVANLSDVLERVRQAYEPAAEDAGTRLLAEIAPAVRIVGDEELLAQLVSNLVENAFIHAPRSQAVGLQLRREGAQAVISVADQGPGVPPGEREKVTRRFYRLDRSRSTPGAGLGLAMVQAIAQLHRGEVELADNAPGLIARVRLPGVLDE